MKKKKDFMNCTNALLLLNVLRETNERSEDIELSWLCDCASQSLAHSLTSTPSSLSLTLFWILSKKKKKPLQLQMIIIFFFVWSLFRLFSKLFQKNVVLNRADNLSLSLSLSLSFIVSWILLGGTGGYTASLTHWWWEGWVGVWRKRPLNVQEHEEWE